jgi:hypothetical protein
VPPPRPPGPDAARAGPDLLHRAYSGLLSRLTLSKAHREALKERGLTDEEIDRRGYRSLPVQGRARLAHAIREQLGDALLTVPGLVTKPGKDGRLYLTIAGAAGLLVPVRDALARVVALLVRRDDASDGSGKYRYITSAKHGGPGPGSPPHVPLGVTGPCSLCRLTEGALKADVAFALSGVPTIGAAGLAWKPALDVLAGLGCKTVRLAYDADALDNPNVARAVAACREAAAAAGLAVEMERWDKADGKGIDDLLAAGKTPDVLSGDAARQAIAEILAAATADAEPEGPPAIGRLREALANGPEAVYRDVELLKDLARLAEENPAEWQCCRAAAQTGGLRLRDLDAALAPHRQALRSKRPALDRAGCYRISGGRLFRDVMTPNGMTEVALANWSGRIVEEVVRDDGVERHMALAVEGALVDGTPLPRAEVTADEWTWMRWPVEHWGTRAVVLAGAEAHLRCALQLLSGGAPRRTVYGHTGWREVGGAWCYLHGGGAVGPDGPASGVEVVLSGTLADFRLPDPPDGGDLAAAVKASLALLDGLAPDRLVFPLLGAVYRAALGEAPGPIDLSLHLAGEHGAGKSELAALCQQHFGPGMDRLHLPGTWLSTGNALEGLAFAANDALLVVDDFAPRGSPGDRQRLEREADRLLRAQGNRAGRLRMRPDSSLRPEKPPRGLILSTGEDTPGTQSLRGRMFILEVAPGDVPLGKLTPYQRDAAAGLYARAMAGFLHWLARQYSQLCRTLPARRAALRDRALTGAGSPRTPGIVADLMLGLTVFLEFTHAAGVVAGPERADLDRRAWKALAEAANQQVEHVLAAEPVGHFLRLLVAALASGRAHVAGPDGQAPETPAAWGWRSEDTRDGPAWRPHGKRIGWLDGVELYLEPDAAYAAAQELARDQGEALPVSMRTLVKRLKDKGLLSTWDQERQRNTVRRRLEGRDRREVINLRQEALYPRSEPSPPSPDAENTGKNAGFPGDGQPPGPSPGQCDRPQDRPQTGDAGDGPGDGPGDGCTAPRADCPQESPEIAGKNGPGDGGDGRLRGERHPLPEINTSSMPQRRRGTL